jgi:hypothetical protein
MLVPLEVNTKYVSISSYNYGTTSVTVADTVYLQCTLGLCLNSNFLFIIIK